MTAPSVMPRESARFWAVELIGSAACAVLFWLADRLLRP